MAKTTANSKASLKPKAKPRGKPWPKGVSGNPAGAPKRGESWQEIIKRIGELTPGEAAQRSLELSKQLLSIGDGVTLKEAVVLRVYGALLFDPQASLLNSMMDRAEGKITQPMDMTWRERAVEAGMSKEKIDKLSVTIDQVMTGKVKLVPSDSDGE